MHIIIFEDELHDNFYPLSLMRPLWELRSGLYSFRERLELFVQKQRRLSVGGFYYFTREYLAPYFREKYPEAKINDRSVFEKDGELFFINATRYPSEEDFAIEKNSVVVLDGVPVVARLDGSAVKNRDDSIPAMLMKSGLREIEYSGAYKSPDAGRKANFIWDLMDTNPDTVKSDVQLAGLKGNGKSRKDVTIIGDGNQVYIEDSAVIDPCVVIDASAGPVVIRKGSRINSFTRIEGPSYIGCDCVVLGAKIRSGTSLGDCCRIGGEIEQSIFHGYSNKYHDGFIGHAYIGEWVNMGALTTNSDLKNNYTNVKVFVSGARKKTGKKKIGCFMGDHVKTSIGTLMNTGTSIGTGAMLVHAGNMTPTHIPPFTWYMDNTLTRLSGLDNFLDTCRAAMSRRDVAVTDALVELIKTLFAMTEMER
ncbi:MAG: hypothetical protein JW807_02920 [Spirochaetes bacterium]|nr:hypothetical protein [Spirochaetota bacterium]